MENKQQKLQLNISGNGFTRLKLGEAWMWCSDCMSKLYSFDGSEDMKQETLQLTGGAGKDKRRELDYYPTPKNVTRALMNFMFKNGCMESTTTIWEPALIS